MTAVIAPFDLPHHPEEDADCARDHAAWQSQQGLLGPAFPTACEADAKPEAEEDKETLAACAVDGKTVRACSIRPGTSPARTSSRRGWTAA